MGAGGRLKLARWLQLLRPKGWLHMHVGLGTEELDLEEQQEK
jgi:hypothetical protein